MLSRCERKPAGRHRPRHWLRDYPLSVAETPPSHHNAHGYTHEQTNEIVANRAIIEQAKGVLMFIYDIDADAAFDVLRRRSRTTHVKLRLLAEQLIQDLVALTPPRTVGLAVSVQRPAAQRA